MAIYHQGNNQQMSARMLGKGILLNYWWECRLLQPVQISVWSLLNKLKIELPYALTVPLVNIHRKEPKSSYNRDICTPCLLQHNSQYVPNDK
jgi:hypothetical protein